MTTVRPATPFTATTHTPRLESGRWALAGVAGGAAGIAAVVASMTADAVYREELAGDAAGITDQLGEQTSQLLVFHTAGMVSALLLVVFGAGLRRRLAAATPQDSLLPQVALTGITLVSVALLMGTALDTEFIFGVRDPDLLVPETAVFFGHWVGTVPWLWAGAGLAALAVGVAGRSHRAVPTWLTWFSLVLGGLVTLFAVSPLQYMAGMLGPVWVTVAAIGLLGRS